MTLGMFIGAGIVACALGSMVGCAEVVWDEPFGGVDPPEIEAGSGGAGLPLDGGAGGRGGVPGGEGGSGGYERELGCALTATTCRVRMQCSAGSGAAIDRLLEVRRISGQEVQVVDGVDTETPWVELVEIGLDGTLTTTAGVPHVTCAGLLESYSESIEGPDSYQPVEGYICAEQDTALIRFFVHEWFYFG